MQGYQENNFHEDGKFPFKFEVNNIIKNKVFTLFRLKMKLKR